MKKTILFALAATFIVCGTENVSAIGDFEITPLTLTKADLKPEPVFTSLNGDFGEEMSAIPHPSVATRPNFSPEVQKYQLTWMRTNEGVKPYKFLDDLTFVGVPLFVADRKSVV